MAGPGAKGGMFRKGSNGKRVLITKSMAAQMAAGGMSAQTDEEYADQAAKLREQNNAEAKAKRQADVAARTLKEEVQALKTEVVNSDIPKASKSRVRKLIEEMEELQKQDIQNASQVFAIAAKATKTAENLLGAKSNPGQTINPLKQLPGQKQKTGRSRFGNLVDNLEALNKQDIKNAAQAYGNAAKAIKIAQTVVNAAEVKEPKKLKGKSKKKYNKKSK